MAVDLTTFLIAFPELDDPVGSVTSLTATGRQIEAVIAEVTGVHTGLTEIYGADPVVLRDGATVVTSTEYASLLLSAHLFIANRHNGRHGRFGVGQLRGWTTASNETVNYATDVFDDIQDKLLATTPYGRRLISLRDSLVACTVAFPVI